MSQRQWQRARSEKGYSWMFFHAGSAWVTGLLTTILITGTGAIFYALYCQFGNDAAPDSIAGYAYAIGGTCCTLLAATLYSIRRSSHKLALGQLNVVLNWHIFFAITGLALLFMHSFGNFNAKTGTYALYALIALMISGFVGRAIDRLAPWLIAREVDKILRAQGEDRVESIARNIQQFPQELANAPLITRSLPTRHYTAPTRGFSVPGWQGSPDRYVNEGQPMSMPWDLAFIAPPATQGELVGEEDIRNFMSNKHPVPVRAGRESVLLPRSRQQAREIRNVERGLQREEFYRYVIHYWRLFHIGLALLTIGLIAWHLVYVGQLLYNAFMHPQLILLITQISYNTSPYSGSRIGQKEMASP